MPANGRWDLIQRLKVKLNNKGLKQNLAIHDYKTRHRLDFQNQFCRTDIFKKSVNNLETKLYMLFHEE